MPPKTSRKQRERWIVTAVLAICGGLALAAFVVLYGPAYLAIWNYAPQEGDIVFQSLQRSPLVNAIEGVSQSPYSHCGIVARRDGKWIVYEAFHNVEATPLRQFLFRGREQGFAVYRLRPAYRPFVPATIEHAAQYLGRPYDVRYRMDDEKIYCSELIFKAYRQASGGDELGRLTRLGDLNWRPFVKTIEHFEQGPVPLDREIITPQAMAATTQLEFVTAFQIEAVERSRN
jgi:hypothetical protein